MCPAFHAQLQIIFAGDECRRPRRRQSVKIVCLTIDGQLVFHLHVVLADCGFDRRRKGTQAVTTQWSKLRKFPCGGLGRDNRFVVLLEIVMVKVLGKNAYCLRW